MPETVVRAFGRSSGGALLVLLLATGAQAQMSLPASQPPSG